MIKTGLFGSKKTSGWAKTVMARTHWHNLLARRKSAHSPSEEIARCWSACANIFRTLGKTRGGPITRSGLIAPCYNTRTREVY